MAICNSHYGVKFISIYRVSGILPRFFTAGKPLSQGYLFKMRIAGVEYGKRPEFFEYLPEFCTSRRHSYARHLRAKS